MKTVTTVTPNVIMLVGLPCSGKTTYRKKFLNGFVLSTDDYILDIAKIRKVSYGEAFKDSYKDAEKFLYQDLQWAVNAECSFVWDQTNLTKESRQRKLAMIPNTYIKKAIVFPVPTLDEFHQRNLNRLNAIPESVFLNLRKTFHTNLEGDGFDEITFISPSFFEKVKGG